MSGNLENLVKIGKLKAEPFICIRVQGVGVLGEQTFSRCPNEALSAESRFDLTYNALHALALAALRRQGYRSEKRAIVFQVPDQTAGMPAAKVRVLSKCHDMRNLAEYEGHADIDPRLLTELVKVAGEPETLVTGSEGRVCMNGLRTLSGIALSRIASSGGAWCRGVSHGALLKARSSQVAAQRPKIF